MLAAGAAPTDPALTLACEFLTSHQRDDGAWGEHPDSCRTLSYREHAEPQAVNTAWALLTMGLCGQGDGGPARRAAQFLVRRQLPDGDWPREALKGVFNNSTLIDYDNYRRIFPLWALGRFKAAGGQL